MFASGSARDKPNRLCTIVLSKIFPAPEAIPPPVHRTLTVAPVESHFSRRTFQMSLQDNKKEIASERGSSTVPLLAEEDGFHASDYDSVRKKSRLSILPLLVHFTIFCTYTIAFFTYSNISQQENCHQSLIYSKSLLQYTTQLCDWHTKQRQQERQ